jgi:microcystin-dependent protein
MEPLLAEIKMFAGNFAPKGWAFCNGQLLPISQNTALFSLLGTTYGGDGVTTFALPNLQGRAPVHVGTGAGLPPVALGGIFGSPSVSLLVTNLPAHNHTLAAVTGVINVFAAPGSVRTPDGNLIAGDAAGDANYEPDTGGTTGKLSPLSLALTTPPATGATGGSLPVSTQSPSLGINFIIALEGTFPSRS